MGLKAALRGRICATCLWCTSGWGPLRLQNLLSTQEIRCSTTSPARTRPLRARAPLPPNSGLEQAVVSQAALRFILLWG